MLKTTLRLLGTTALLGATLAPAAHASQTLKLDLANPANLDPAGVAAQSDPLVKGAQYVVTVSGTGSIWAPNVPAPITCGLPERAPVVEPTPGQPAAPPNVDAALLFSAPQGIWLGDSGDACSTTGPAVNLPIRGGLRMGGAAGMVSVSPIGGDPTKPNATHTYSYAVTGDGTPLRAQYSDMWTADNSGILTLTIRSAAECKTVGCAPVVPTTPPATTPAPTTPTGSTCPKTTVIVLRGVAGKGLRFKKIQYLINGLLRSTDTGLRTKTFDGLPTGDFKVTIVAFTSGGKRLTGAIKVAGCTAGGKKKQLVSIR